MVKNKKMQQQGSSSSSRRIADTIAGLKNPTADAASNRSHLPRSTITNSAIAMDDYLITQKQQQQQAEMCSHFIPVRNDSVRPAVFTLSHDDNNSVTIFPASLMLEPGESGMFEALVDASKIELDFVLKDVTSLREFKFTYTNLVVDEEEEDHDAGKRLLCSDPFIQLDGKVKARKFKLKNAHHTFCVLTAHVQAELPHSGMFTINVDRKRLASGDEVEGLVESLSGEAESSSSCVIAITAKFVDSRKPHRFHLKVYSN